MSRSRSVRGLVSHWRASYAPARDQLARRVNSMGIEHLRGLRDAIHFVRTEQDFSTASRAAASSRTKPLERSTWICAGRPTASTSTRSTPCRIHAGAAIPSDRQADRRARIRRFDHGRRDDLRRGLRDGRGVTGAADRFDLEETSCGIGSAYTILRRRRVFGGGSSCGAAIRSATRSSARVRRIAAP